MLGRRLPRRSLIAAVLGISTLLATAGPALANLHATGDWFSATTNNGGGAVVQMTSNQIASNNDFLAQVLWEGSNSDTGCNYWTEVGLTHGWGGQNILTLYWADVRPNGGGYHEHKLSAGHWNTNYGLNVTYAGNSTWYVWVNSVNSGSSIANPGPSRCMETGLESTSTSNSGYSGWSNSMQWKDTGNSWHNYWGNTTGMQADPPTTIGWITTDWYLKDTQNP